MENTNNSKELATSTSNALQQKSQQTAVSLSERYRTVTTIAQAFQLQERPLAKAEGNVRGSIILHLGALARFLNLRNTLTDEHIEFITDKILADDYYKWLKPADLKIFFDRIKMGKYGDFYGNLNSISFFQALNRYMIERNSIIEEVRQQEAQQRRETLKGVNLGSLSGLPQPTVPPTPITKPSTLQNSERQRRVANTAQAFVNNGMSWPQAMKKAIEMIENQ